MTIWRMRIACWIPKATDAHSQYVIINVIPVQQWLHERALMLRFTYIASLVIRKYLQTQRPCHEIIADNLSQSKLCKEIYHC